MKTRLAAFIYTLLLFFLSTEAAAASLDDLYRDIIRSDNQGYLPLFVKNRKMPDILGTEKITARPSSDAVGDTASQKLPEAVSLVNPIPARKAALKAKELKWEQTLKTIEQNRVTPLELDELHRRLHLNDPKAIEVLAWMYTKGVGVQVDYIEAYKLYRKAALLNVPQAKENARLVFQSMNDEQRKKIKGY